MKQWHIHHVDKRMAHMREMKDRGNTAARVAERVRPEGTTPRVAWLADLVEAGALHRDGRLLFPVTDPDTGETIPAEPRPVKTCPMCQRGHQRTGATCSRRCALAKQVASKKAAGLTAGTVRRKAALLAAYGALRH